MKSKNLSPKMITLLRRVQKFLLKEPRRFNMRQGITNYLPEDMLEQPPCGTACCIAGAAYAISTRMVFDNSSIRWWTIEQKMSDLGFGGTMGFRLFFISEVHQFVIAGVTGWPTGFSKLYIDAKTRTSVR